MINLWESAGLLFVEGSVLLTTIHYLENGYLHLVTFPWIYLLMVFFVYLQYRRMHKVERAAFGVKISLPWRQWFISVIAGLIASLMISTILSLSHQSIPTSTVLWVWGLTLLFAIIDTRLTCISYSTAVLGVLQPLALLLINHGVKLPFFLQTLAATQLLVLLFITGLAHVMEGILIHFFGYRGASPLFVESRRGQIVGGFVLQKFWPLPVMLSSGGLVTPFPILVGFSDITLGQIPKRAVERTWWMVCLFGLITLVLYAVAVYQPNFAFIAAILVGLLHEVMYKSVRARDVFATPIFVRPNRGVRVLATLPFSPAKKMGLTAGDTIVKVGGMAVNSPYDIHFAIDQNPAYVKLEVLDLRGELRFMGTPVFTKDPHQIGIIAVPDEHAREYAAIYPLSIGKWVWRWWNSVRPSIEL